MNTQPTDGALRRRARQIGFTLTEVLIATLLIGAAVAAADAFFMAARAKAMMVEDPTANMLADEVFMLAQLLPREPSGLNGVTSGADVVALNNLIGAVFAPPVLANTVEYAGLAGWTQQVDIKLSTVDNPGVATGDDPAVALGENSPMLYLVSVTILEGTSDRGTFTRLMRP